MKGRKTIEVQEVLDWSNRQLSRTDDAATQDFKSGISVMIEKLLMESGNYNGFTYVNVVGQPNLEYNRYYY